MEEQEGLLLPTQSFLSYRHFYVVFGESDGGLPWYQRMAIKNDPPQFHHVALVKPVTEIHAIVMEPLSDAVYMELTQFNGSVAEQMGRVSVDRPVVSYIAEPQGSRHVTNIVPSCVSVIKAMIGLDTWAITPLGLFRYLLENGGVCVNKTHEDMVEWQRIKLSKD